MSRSACVGTLILIVMLTLSTDGCKENPTAPGAETPPTYLSGGRFHGTWFSVYNQIDTVKISFDSTAMRFIDQFGYEYGIRREFPGTYTVTSEHLLLDYDYGNHDTLAYEFNQNGLALRRSSIYLRQLTRASLTPSYDGWSRKLPVNSELTFYSRHVSVLSFCNSDSGAVALGVKTGAPTRYLWRVHFGDFSAFSIASGIWALDARGPYLWIVTDSTIEKRTISDPTAISSFSFRLSAGLGYQATGLAVESTYCFLMTTDNTNHQGKLLKYTLGGDLLGSTLTSLVIRDLCLVNGRLFCLLGDETFVELNTETGRVIANYSLRGRPFGNNLDGIALVGNMIQFASRDSLGNLRLTNIDIP